MFATITLLTSRLLHAVLHPPFLLQSLKRSVVPSELAVQRGEDCSLVVQRRNLITFPSSSERAIPLCGLYEGAQVFGSNYLLCGGV